jgi:phosphoribosylaminoimidazolecarboxamide formyltransferase / IMP cyclohydrolase
MNQKYALLSVYDKINIVSFAKQLADLSYKIISSGGTAKTLEMEGIPVIPIQEITGNPESFDGRIKTISFQIESGILFDRSKKTHIEEAEKLGTKPIDIVVGNFYPFRETVEKKEVTEDEVIENIDVGGPTMLRSAAKNHRYVLPICNPEDYQEVIEKLKSGEVSIEYRRELAQKAFEYLSFYDSLISSYFRGQTEIIFPSQMSVPLEKILDLRYGDNPHQKASLYLRPTAHSPLRKLEKLGGRDLSSINVTDINAGMESIRLFDEPAAVVIKHNAPCGIALGESSDGALDRAIEADPESAFGGVVVMNRPLNLKSIEIINSFKEEYHGQFDILAVPGIEDEAIEPVKNIRKSMGIYVFGNLRKPSPRGISYKEVIGGFVRQTQDWDFETNYDKWEVVTKHKPTEKQLEQMKLAWTMIRRVRSNAVVVVDKDLPMTRGIGTGQTSRFRATKLALELAGEKNSEGALLASDAFFPFSDSVEQAAKYKIGAIVQPGGSIQDKLSIEAADKAGIPMVFTHERVFWHY